MMQQNVKGSNDYDMHNSKLSGPTRDGSIIENSEMKPRIQQQNQGIEQSNNFINDFRQ